MTARARHPLHRPRELLRRYLRRLGIDGRWEGCQFVFRTSVGGAWCAFGRPVDGDPIDASSRAVRLFIVRSVVRQVFLLIDSRGGTETRPSWIKRHRKPRPHCRCPMCWPGERCEYMELSQ